MRLNFNAMPSLPHREERRQARLEGRTDSAQIALSMRISAI
jgi:hypothetical protein